MSQSNPTDLRTRLAGALSFDWTAMRTLAIRARGRMGHEADCFADGAKAESTRLAHLHAALADCVGALEFCAAPEIIAHGEEKTQRAREALARLGELLGDGEGK